MMPILLTLDTGEQVCLDGECVTAALPTPTGTRVYLGTSWACYVQESPEKINELLKEANSA